MANMQETVDAFVADFDSAYEELEISFSGNFDPYKLELSLLEADKEDLIDKLNDSQATVNDQAKTIDGLTAENERLKRENALLKGLHVNVPSGDDVADLQKELQEANLALLKFKKLNDELIISKELAEKKMHQEKLLRLHSDKEKEAYALAFSSSLGHFEKWVAPHKLNIQ